jgi:hypothetical protein
MRLLPTRKPTGGPKSRFPDRQQAGWVDFSAGLLYAAPR